MSGCGTVQIQRKLLGPQVFVLERMLAIFHAILPFEVSSSPADIYTQVRFYVYILPTVHPTFSFAFYARHAKVRQSSIDHPYTSSTYGTTNTK